MDNQKNNEWHISAGEYISRHSDFMQSGFQYNDKDISIKIMPEPLRAYTITLGPPYIPIVPFLPIYLFPDRNELICDVSISSLNNNSFIDLSKIKLSINGFINEYPKVLIDKDTTEYFDWEVINIYSPDSSQYVINISQKKLAFKIKSNANINHIDSISIIIEGININNRNIKIPELLLIRKGKFYYMPYSAA